MTTLAIITSLWTALCGVAFAVSLWDAVAFFAPSWRRQEAWSAPLAPSLAETTEWDDARSAAYQAGLEEGLRRLRGRLPRPCPYTTSDLVAAWEEGLRDVECGAIV